MSLAIPGVKAAHAIITPACRENRGVDAAFEEAVRRLREAYRDALFANPSNTVKVHLAAFVEWP